MEKLFTPVRLFLGWKKTIVLLILLIIVITPVALYQFGTSYYPLYSFDDHLHQKVIEKKKNVNANKIRFKTQKVKEDIREKVAQEKVTDLNELISLCLRICKTRLYYDTSTLLGRKNTDRKKAYRQHDIDWLYENGHANCIGYAYLFAAIFNELKELNPDVDSCSVRIIYESPVHILFGYIKMKHTWNEIVCMKHGKETKLHLDANAADYYLPWNVTKFLDENHLQ